MSGRECKLVSLLKGTEGQFPPFFKKCTASPGLLNCWVRPCDAEKAIKSMFLVVCTLDIALVVVRHHETSAAFRSNQ